MAIGCGPTVHDDRPTDLDALMEAATGRVWNGLPDGSVIGHVHLQVGDIALAERFYADVLGFAVAHRYPGASFFASGGYHHQIAANIWNSRGAGRRSDEAAGLKSFEITLRNPADLDAIVDRAHRASLAPEDQQGAVFVRDPWGIQVKLMAD